MLNAKDILETITMIDEENLDIRTITMGISLLSCADRDAKAACEKIYDKITRYAEGLVKTGEDIEREFGIPIVNKRISVTPIALVAAASETEDYVPFAVALDRAAKAVGVNFIGGFSALVQKGMTDADRRLIAAIPEALAVTDLVCSSVNVGSTKAGINMDAVKLMGRIIKDTAARTAKRGGRTLELSAREYALLEYLIRSKGVVLSRQQIEDNLWSLDYAGGTNVVDVYISYLRKKLELPGERKLLHTVRGMGWVLKEDA